MAVDLDAAGPHEGRDRPVWPQASLVEELGADGEHATRNEVLEAAAAHRPSLAEQTALSLAAR